MHTLTKMKLQTLPHSLAYDYQIRFIDQPIVSISLSTLNKIFSKGIQLTTNANFKGAL
jgi:hypothetical protein